MGRALREDQVLGKVNDPLENMLTLVSLTLLPPNRLITLLLGKRPSRENPAGSLRSLDLKGLSRSSACSLLLTQEEIQPSGRQSPDGLAFLPLTKLLVQKQKMNRALQQPTLNSVSYLMGQGATFALFSLTSS